MSEAAVFTTRVGNLPLRPLVFCGPETPIREAARRMAEGDTGSVVVVDAAGNGVGIVTDSDLRRRVVAVARDPTRPLRDVMSAPLVTIRPDALGLEAIQVMLERGIHHVAVIDDSGRVRNVVADSDIVGAEASGPLFLARRIERAGSVEELAAARATYPRTVQLLLEGGASSVAVGHILAEANDRLTRRLIAMAEATLGKPPAEYCWLSMGSEGRRHQTLKTDQDNGLIWSDGAADADAYFEGFATWMVDALERTGAPRCPGDVMATNELWRGSLTAWRERFAQWLAVPRPEALLRSLIAFDFRGVAGVVTLAEELRAWLLPRVASASRVLVHIAQEAALHRAPLNPIGGVSTARGGTGAGAFDAKLAISPVVNGARLLALEHQIASTNTRERLEAAQAMGAIPEEDARELLQAYEFIQLLRLQRQLELARRAQPLDNRIYPGTLTHADQARLREHVRAIDRFRRAIEHARALQLRGA